MALIETTGAVVSKDIQTTHCGGGCGRVWRGRGEVAAEANERLDLAAAHRIDRMHYIMAMLGGSKPKHSRIFRRKAGVGFSVNPNRAIALHVGMAAHRT